MEWRRLLGPLRIIVSAGLIIYLIWHADPAQVWDRWRAADLRFVALAVVIQLAGIAINAVRWGVLLRARGQQQPYTWLLKAYLAGQFANNFLPTSVGGDAVRAAQLARRIGSLSQASASVFLERLVGFLALSMIVNGALIWGYLDHTGRPLVTTPELRLLTVLFTLAAVIAMVASFSAPRLLLRFGPRLPPAIRKPVQRIAQALGDYFPQGRTLAKVLGLSLVYQTLWIVNHIVCGMALQIDAPTQIYFLMVPITDMVGLAPIFVNNLGAREAVFTLYLAQVEVVAATAIALAFLIFTVRLVVSTLGGLVVLFGGIDLKTSVPPAAPLADPISAER
jgi:glycosyltransferase 2 family protein